MSRRWKIVIAVVVVLAVLLAANTIALDNETKSATPGGDGRIYKLPGGDIKVYEDGDASKPPMVLIHCFACSADWWDRITPLLAKDFHVIRMDLLGHGDSEKPSSGYSMEQQARLVAVLLGKLKVEGAVVVGHSMGGDVGTALAEESSELVDRFVVIDSPPKSDQLEPDLLGKLSLTPVIGEAMKRTATDGLVKDGLGQAFAKGYDVPDEFVKDLNKLTYTAFRDSAHETEDFENERPLNVRMTSAAIPLMVILGKEDQLVDVPAAKKTWQEVPGVRIAEISGSGHSPNVEKPEETAALIKEFAAEAGDEARSPEPKKKQKQRKKQRKR